MKRLLGTTLSVGFVVLSALSAPAVAGAGRSVELVLDASGSMNAKLPSGERRLDAARSALREVVTALPADLRLAFRAYGHQFPTAKKECNDTALLVPFGAAGQVGSAIVERSRTLEARGYTPITAVLGVAAGDFTAEPSGERAIILVSDGKETCAGDPCATARALKAAHADLVVHTIGFDVDVAARLQLTCIARSTGGQYFDAGDVKGLAAALGAAARATMTVVKSEAAKPGNLTVRRPDYDHEVIDAVSGKVVTSISGVRPSVAVPPGVYNVTFGEVAWKGIAVEAGKETVLDPGVLEIANAGYDGHSILESETGVVQGTVTSVKQRLTLIPGTYDLTFGPLLWRGVRVDGGQVVVLHPAVVRLRGGKLGDSVAVFTREGVKVGEMVFGHFWLPVPAGEYLLELGGARRPITLAEGQVEEVSLTQ